jgi:N-acetylglucosamine-6-phosphate deacetylase
MRALDHREPGILGAVLADENVSADIIADGIHVAPAVIEVFLKAKGPLNSVLITDAISATGMPDGQYRLGAFDVDVLAGRCTSGGKLAGSVLTLDSAVRNVMEFANLTLAQAVRMASSNPARVLGLPAGRLQVGARADIVILSQDGNVIRTFVAGQ